MLSQIRYIDTLLMLKSVFLGRVAEVVLRSKTLGQSILSHSVVPPKPIGMTKIFLMGQDMHPLPVRGLLYKTY